MDSTLYIAAVFGDIGVLKQNKDKLVDETTPKNNTVLHLVSHFGKTECVPEIISMVPSLIHRVNSNNESALHIAARKGHYDVVRELMRCAVSLESGVESGVGSVKEMLRMRNKHGDTALYDAVRYKHCNVVEVLIREDPEFSHPANNAGETPLYIAAERGYDDLVDVILKTCTSPAYGGPSGRTALHAAIFSNSEESTRRLLAWKQSLIKETDERGWSPLHYAAFFNHEEIVSYLLSLDGSIAYLVDNDTNTDIIQRDVNGNTPLHQLAASKSYAEKLIYHAMADKKALNNENFTPLGMVKDDDDLYPVLKSAGATRDLRNSINIGEGKGGINQNEDDEKRRKEDAEKTRKEDDEQIGSWRKRSDTIMIVAALIATVTFTAGFTMPGGYIQSGSTNQGMAVLSRKTAFQVFIVSDVIALILSSFSMFLNFLAAMFDDLYKLRKTVRLAIFVVVVAIGAMMVAFSTGTYVVLAQTSALAIVTCVIGVLFVPIYVSMFCKFYLDDEI